MHASFTPHPFIVFVDADGKRLDQIDLWAVDAPAYHESMVAAANNVQLYVDGALKMFSVDSITFSHNTGYTFVTVSPLPDHRAPQVGDDDTPGELEGQMSIDDYGDVGGC
jgi:hypothetical protein